MTIEQLSSEQCFQACPLEWIPCETSDDVEQVPVGVGQNRAVEAIEFGIHLESEGYNLYVAGAPGLGQSKIVESLLADISGHKPCPLDWCYVQNFEVPHKPKVIALPSGKGAALKKDMRKLVLTLLDQIPDAFKSDDYMSHINEIKLVFDEKEQAAFNELQDLARSKNVVVMRSPHGYTLSPTLNGKVIKPDAYANLPPARKEEFDQAIDEVNEQLKRILQEIPKWQSQVREQIEAINHTTIKMVVEPIIHLLMESYKDHEDVGIHLNAVLDHILDTAQEFLPENEDSNNHPEWRIQEPQFIKYDVNLLVDNSEVQGAPIVYEANPSYKNVMGRVEHVAQMGMLLTDFTLIKPGALHRANGGYLILDARQLLMNGFVWEALKQALKSKEIKIESIEDRLSLSSTVTLEPTPVPLDVKIVLLGDRYLFYLLNQYDTEFSQLFKVLADFSEMFDRTEETVALYTKLLAGLIQDHKLKPFKRSALKEVIEFGSREVADKEKLTLQHSYLESVLIEADYWAGLENAEQVDAIHVQEAVEKRRYFSNQLNERIQEAIERDIVLIDTQGVQVGQINGLSVLSIGDVAFGKPSRITATARVGNGKIIDIEREAELAGAIHSKGVMILTACLASRYAVDHPLSLAASLGFEQSYGGIDGDSASAAELCVLLSAIGEIPLKQNLAITGSINQHGVIQAIGGVNEKIEGFFDLCSARGLTGDQGVIIPKANQKHLMLSERVRDAINQHQFHIYTAEALEDAMELLSGIEMGEKDSKGQYPSETINGRVIKRLDYFRKQLEKDNQLKDKNQSGDSKS